jgi:hypothetical protein
LSCPQITQIDADLNTFLFQPDCRFEIFRENLRNLRTTISSRGLMRGPQIPIIGI